MSEMGNVLALRLRGIEPRSGRRRLKYLVRFWLPFACYAAVLAGMTALCRVRGDFFVATCLTPGIIALGVAVLRGSGTGAVEQFRRNRQDYRLAGIPARDVLWAYAQPEFKSGLWFTLTAFAIAILAGPLVLGDMLGAVMYWVLLSIIVDAGFILTGGTLADRAAWTKTSGVLPRMVAAGILLLFSQTAALAFVFMLWWFGALADPTDATVYFLLAITTILTMGWRVLFVLGAWQMAIQRMDGDLD